MRSALQRTRTAQHILALAIAIAVIRFIWTSNVLGLLQVDQLPALALIVIVSGIAAFGLTRAAGLFFRRPWYAQPLSMVLLVLATKAIVTITAILLRVACDRFVADCVLAQRQWSLIVIIIVLSLTLCMDRPIGSGRVFKHNRSILKSRKEPTYVPGKQQQTHQGLPRRQCPGQYLAQ